MFDRFSDRSKKMMSLARRCALELRHECIAPEHLLFAVVELGGSSALRMLAAMEIDPLAVKHRLAARVLGGPRPVDVTQMPFTDAAKRVLEHCLLETQALGHHSIRSGHVLLGLLRDEGVAGTVLRDLGAAIEAARAELRDIVANTPMDADSDTPVDTSRRRLLLISNSTMHGGGYLAHCATEIRDFLGERQRVAFVPYALADHDGYEQKAKAAFAAMGHDLFSVHHEADPVDAVHAATAVFIGGGNTFRLLRALYRTHLLPVIRQAALAGMPYIGSSAGTNVATLSIRTTNDMPIVQPPSLAALDLVPFQINPHYLDADPASKHMGETREERIRQFHEEDATPVLGLREGCMLRVEGDRIDLRGTTNARLFCRGAAPAEYAPPCDLSFLAAPTSAR